MAIVESVGGNVLCGLEDVKELARKIFIVCDLMYGFFVAGLNSRTKGPLVAAITVLHVSTIRSALVVTAEMRCCSTNYLRNFSGLKAATNVNCDSEISFLGEESSVALQLSIVVKFVKQSLMVSFANDVARAIQNVHGNYFGVYCSFGIRRELISDKVRTDFYRAAILNSPSLMSHAIVLDVGCGIGILSLFAAQALSAFLFPGFPLALEGDRNAYGGKGFSRAHVEVSAYRHYFRA